MNSCSKTKVMNEKANVSGRMGMVDCWRFIFSILVMTHHLHVFGLKAGEYPFYFAWIYVEFFFVLTGYYTTRHFAGLLQNEDKTPGEKVQYSVQYVLNKFKKIFPYTGLAIFLSYMVEFRYNFAGGGYICSHNI